MGYGMSRSKPKRKIKSASSSRRRRFIGARIEFDGIEENYQIAEFSNGRDLNAYDVDDLIKFEFKWNIYECKLIYKNCLGFTRTKDIHFKTPEPIRFNDLKPFVDEQATITGLEMPEGYGFDRNTWKARIIG